MDIFHRIGILLNEQKHWLELCESDSMNRKGKPMCIIYILIKTMQR